MTTDRQGPAASPKPRLSQALRAFLAFLVGILLFTALAAAFGKLAGVQAPPRPGEEKLQEILVCLAAAMLVTGYVAGRIAGVWEVPVGAALGVLLALGAGPANITWQGMERPLATMVSLLVLPPCAALGAWGARRMARSQAQKRAAGPAQWPVEIRQRAWVVWLAFFLAAGMTAAAAWILLETNEAPRLGWTGVLFFGFAALVLGRRGLQGKPQAVLREEGIELAVFRTVIPWSEIEGAAPSRAHPVEYVRLQVRDPQRYLDRLSPLQRALTQTGEAEPNFGIALTGTPYTAEEICALVNTRVGKS